MVRRLQAPSRAERTKTEPPVGASAAGLAQRGLSRASATPMMDALRRFLSVSLVVLVGVFAGPAVASAAESPPGLTAAAVDGGVDLSWQPVAGASAYNVYRGLTSGTTTT